MKKLLNVRQTDPNSKLLEVIWQYDDGKTATHYAYAASIELHKLRESLWAKGVSEADMDKFEELVLEGQRQSHCCENEGGCCL